MTRFLISVDRVSGKLNGFKGISADGTKKSLESRIKNSIKEKQRHKTIPYIQMYKFEVLLFSDAEIMANNLNVSQGWIDNILNEFNDLEGINNSKETALSKRIGKNAKYIKIQHAPKILQEIWLLKIRKRCQGLNAWLMQLESLSE